MLRICQKAFTFSKSWREVTGKKNNLLQESYYRENIVTGGEMNLDGASDGYESKADLQDHGWRVFRKHT